MSKQELLKLAEKAGLHWKHVRGEWLLDDEQCYLLANPDCSQCNGNGFIEYTDLVPRPFGPGNVQMPGTDQCDCTFDTLLEMEGAFTEYELEGYMNFRNWLEDVDVYIEGLVGLTHDDLEGQPWRDWFFGNVSPFYAAITALYNEGLPVQEEDKNESNNHDS